MRELQHALVHDAAATALAAKFGELRAFVEVARLKQKADRGAADSAANFAGAGGGVSVAGPASAAQLADLREEEETAYSDLHEREEAERDAMPVETLFRIERAALHGCGPEPHACCGSLCTSLPGCARSRRASSARGARTAPAAARRAR